MSSQKIKVSLVQDCPVFFDKAGTLKKMAGLVAKCAEAGSRLVVFPESYVPGYPRDLLFGSRIGSRTQEGRQLYAEYHNNSMDLESEDRGIIEQIARSNDVYLVIGITEKENISGSLYCSMVYVSPEKGVMGVHRKLKPTSAERIIWAEGSGDSLYVIDSEIGRLGGLICWENYMPLARTSMYLYGVQIYFAPTADSRETWTTTMQHIALEGRCFVLASNQFITQRDYPARFTSSLKEKHAGICRGGSLIVAPDGNILEGPLFDRKGILSAEIDLSETISNKLDFDPNGHYARKDVFELRIKDQPTVVSEKDL